MNRLKPPKVVFFNFDNTLFDNIHAVKSALAAVKAQYPYVRFKAATFGELVQDYISLHPAPIIPIDRSDSPPRTIEQSATGQYGRHPGDSPHGGYEKFRLDAFLRCCRSEMSLWRARAVAKTYETAYEKDRKPLRHVVEALARMKEAGCQVILHFAPWGKREDYEDKARRMGISGLVDVLVPTSDVGSTAAEITVYCALQVANFSVAHENAVVWVVGAAEARVNPREGVYGFAPWILEQEMAIGDETASDVPFVQHGIGLFLSTFGLARVALQLVLAPDPQDSKLVHVRGLGLDIITCPEMPFTLTAAAAQFLVSAAGLVLIHTANKDFASARCTVCNMLAVLGKAACPLAKNTSLPETRDMDPSELFGDGTFLPPCFVREGPYSFRGEHQRLVVPVEGARDAEFGRMLSAMQGLFSFIMLGRPEWAIQVLTSAADRLQTRSRLEHSRAGTIGT
jgi:FMN phosphatase YigB (HAD superfamily)